MQSCDSSLKCVDLSKSKWKVLEKCYFSNVKYNIRGFFVAITGLIPTLLYSITASVKYVFKCVKSNHVSSKRCLSDKPFDGCLLVGVIYHMHSAFIVPREPLCNSLCRAVKKNLPLQDFFLFFVSHLNDLDYQTDFNTTQSHWVNTCLILSSDKHISTFSLYYPLVSVVAV